MTLGRVIDVYIEDMKAKGVNHSGAAYSDFINLKARLLEFKTMFGYCSTDKKTLEAVRKEYFSNYSPYAPSINTRTYVIERLYSFIDSIK